MTPEAERRMYELEDERKRKREAANAQIMAQKNAEQQAAQNAENQARVRAAFNQTYGPQLQRSYQDAAVQSAPTNTPAGRARDLAIGHGFQYGGMIGQPGMMPGGTVGQPGSDITAYAAGKLPQPTMSQTQLQNTLDHMWRQQTDPYQRAANQMGGMMTLFHPSDAPVREWGATMRGSGGSGKIRNKPQKEEEKGGIDWWKQQNT
jgi:hypothetical protein